MANDNTALIAQVWANESLRLLKNTMVLGSIVHRDFENEIKEQGDTVNASRPNDFKAKRKVTGNNIVVQDASVTKVPVVLDQHLHTSFKLGDKEQSLSFKSLVKTHLAPAMNSITQGVDDILAAQVYEFLPNVVGRFGTAASRTLMTSINKKFNQNKAPRDGRFLVVGPNSEEQFLNDPALIDANRTGDAGTALREASLGKVLNTWITQAQSTPEIIADGNEQIGAINNVAGYAIGDSVLTVDNFVGVDVAVGSWVRIAGDDRPLRVVARTFGIDTTSITVSPALTSPVNDNAVVIATKVALVNNASGYGVGYEGTLNIDGITAAPQIGQLITHALNSQTYGAFDSPSLVTTELTKNLATAVADNDVLGLGPKGNYNFALHGDALALVSRPLAIPAGAVPGSVAVASQDGLSIRVSISYDPNAQGAIVTVDLLMGTAVLDPRLGMVVLT